MRRDIMSYRFGEGVTAGGQTIQFTAPTGEVEEARDSLRHFRDIHVPDSSVVNVEHGGYGRYSRYDIEQIDYGGGQNDCGGGYYEILYINDAPDERVPVVSHGYLASGEQITEFFAEWTDAEAAKKHWDTVGRGRILSIEDFEEKEIPGLIRVVETGYLAPWFYATGDASLVGDYVFPEHLAQDPTFTFGRQFLVPQQSNGQSDQYVHVLKTCMGCVVRDEPKRRDHFGRLIDTPETTPQYRAVQWHDGSNTEIYSSTADDMIPVPLADSDAWVTEAQRKFAKMLGGGVLDFVIPFADGSQFIGKYVPPPEKPKPTPEGDYCIAVTFENGELLEGWVNDFVPTNEYPNVVAYVEDRYRKSGKIIVEIKVLKRKTKNGGKKWGGVFYASLKKEPGEA